MFVNSIDDWRFIPEIESGFSMAWSSLLFWVLGGLTASFFMAVLVGRCMALGQRRDASPDVRRVSSETMPRDALAVREAQSS